MSIYKQIYLQNVPQVHLGVKYMLVSLHLVILPCYLRAYLVTLYADAVLMSSAIAELLKKYLIHD